MKLHHKLFLLFAFVFAFTCFSDAMNVSSGDIISTASVIPLSQVTVKSDDKVMLVRRLLEGLGIPSTSIECNHRLRVVKKLKNGESSYTMSLKGSEGEGEIKLSESDFFVPVFTQVRIAKVEDGKYGNTRPFAYPYHQVFIGATADPNAPDYTEQRELLGVYNGIMSLSAGTDPVISKRFLEKYMAESEYAILGTVNIETLPRISNWIAESALFVLNGEKNNEITIKLGSGGKTTIEGTAGADAYNILVVDFEGVLIRNVADKTPSGKLLNLPGKEYGLLF